MWLFPSINSKTATANMFSDFHRHTTYTNRREITCTSRVNADLSQTGITELVKNLQSYWRETLFSMAQMEGVSFLEMHKFSFQLTVCYMAFSFTFKQLHLKAKYVCLSAFLDWGLTSKAHKNVSSTWIPNLAHKEKLFDFNGLSRMLSLISV